jgi:hypothetical protein
MQKISPRKFGLPKNNNKKERKFYYRYFRHWSRDIA